MRREIIFANFHEALFPPPFLPTYKCRERSTFEINSDTYSAHSGGSSALSNSSGKYIDRLEMTPSTSSSETTNDSPEVGRKQSPTRQESDQEIALEALRKQVYELDHFEYNTSRVPSYTDRILYQHREGLDTYPRVHCNLYTTVPDLFSSDHKPVLAKFEVTIAPGVMDFDTTSSRTLPNSSQPPTSRGNFSPTSKGVSSFFRLRKRQMAGKSTQAELLAGRALSVSTSSLLAASTGNGSAGERVSNSAKQRAFISRIGELNFGDFDRQIYMDGLKLRSAVFAFRQDAKPSAADGELSSGNGTVPAVPAESGVSARGATVGRSWGMFKSRSLDSTLATNSTPYSLHRSYRESPRRDLTDSPDMTGISIRPSRLANEHHRSVAVSAPVTSRLAAKHRDQSPAVSTPTPSASAKSSLCIIS